MLPLQEKDCYRKQEGELYSDFSQLLQIFRAGRTLDHWSRQKAFMNYSEEIINIKQNLRLILINKILILNKY